MPLNQTEIDSIETIDEVRQQECSECGSSDAKTYYRRQFEDQDLGYTWHCFSCGDVRTDVDNVTHLEETGEVFLAEVQGSVRAKAAKKSGITKQLGKFNPLPRWGLVTATVEKYGITSDAKGVYFPSFDSNTGEQIGYKVRHTPLENHESSWQGVPGDSFFGARNCGWVGEGTTLVICEGEPDTAAAYQTMANSRYMFVGVANGVASLPNACAKNAVWLSQFERICYIVDNDDAGSKVAIKMDEKFPEYTRINLPSQYKDVAEMCVSGAVKLFRDTVYGAKSRVLDCIVTAEQMAEAWRSGRGDALSTGLPKLDEALGGGLFPHEMSVIMASPGKGKSTTSRWFVYAVGRNSSVKPLYIPYEESYKLAGAKLGRLYNGGSAVAPEDIDYFSGQMTDHVSIVDTAKAPRFKDAAAFVRWVEALVVASGTTFVCLDHVSQVSQLIPGDERLNIQSIMNGLAEVVKRHPVHISVITHNKRETVQYDDEGEEIEHRPHIRDGFGSGSLERTAFVTLALWGRDNNTKISILKNRNGDMVDKDISLRYLQGGIYIDMTVKEQERNAERTSNPLSVSRGTDGLSARGGRVESEPEIDTGEAETEGVSDNNDTEEVVHTGLHDTERDVPRSEGLPKTGECETFYSHLQRVREGLYTKGATPIRKLKHTHQQNQDDVRPVGSEDGNDIRTGDNDTPALVDTETTSRPATNRISRDTKQPISKKGIVTGKQTTRRFELKRL